MRVDEGGVLMGGKRWGKRLGKEFFWWGKEVGTEYIYYARFVVYRVWEGGRGVGDGGWWGWMEV